MFAREKLLTGVGLALSTVGAFATSYAINDMWLNPQFGVHMVNACEGEQAAVQTVCGPNLVIPGSVEREAGVLALGAGLFAGGAYNATRSANRLGQYQGLMNELFSYVHSMDPPNVSKP